MIQVLTYSGKETALRGKDVVVNSIHTPQSLDEFKINIIILDDDNIWKNKYDANSYCECMDDLKSISIMINNCSNTNIIVVYPQNRNFSYDYYSGGFHKQCELKNMINKLVENNIGSVHAPLKDINIMYENTKTKIDEIELVAAFNFIDGEGVLFSKQSNKKTVIRVGDIYASTLDIKKYDEIIALLKTMGLITDKQEIPEWIEEVKLFDDERQIEFININNELIVDANKKISDAKKALDKNRHLKSVLYTNGDELVNVTFEILQDMLGCDLSGFEDLKKEDFLFNIENHIFIGEIKGVNHNVKNENVSQLDVHYQAYIDENPETNSENISAMLIINHQKNKPLELRETVHENQIKLAERNGSLIIETITLLKMYEKFLANEITREQCIGMIKENKGLLVV